MLQLTLTLEERDMILTLVQVVESLADGTQRIENESDLKGDEVWETIESLAQKAQDA